MTLPVRLVQHLGILDACEVEYLLEVAVFAGAADAWPSCLFCACFFFGGRVIESTFLAALSKSRAGRDHKLKTNQSTIFLPIIHALWSRWDSKGSLPLERPWRKGCCEGWL